MTQKFIAVLIITCMSSAATAADRTARPSVCLGESSTNVLILPAVAHVQGKFGTVFTSDVSIVNYRSVDQRVRILWMSETTPVSPLTLTIAPRTTARYADFASNEVHVTGVGAVLLEAITSSGERDPNAHIDATSRIWTTQPGGTGTTSQTLSARTPTDLYGATAARVIGMMQDQDFRTNVGIVNLTSGPLTFSIRVTGQHRVESFTMTVGAKSMKQLAIPEGVFGPLDLSILPLTSDPQPFGWSAYGVSLDNRTGDGWVVHAVQP